MKNLTEKRHEYRKKPSLWHNIFHLEMPFGLINDPNGLCYNDGTYHIFYQWNPTSCEHKNKNWGYTKTRDFINYTIPQIALAPVDDFDKNGCYSGSARFRNNQMEIFYTANLKDAQGIRYPRQVLAVQNADGSFTKKKFIIEDIPKGYTAHFRDPYLFTHSNRSFLVLGAQRENLTGCVLIYEEINDIWKFRGELQTSYKNFGYMWECPNLFTIDGYDVLLFCPQGLKAQGHKYNNIYQSGYIIGKFDPDALTFTHGEFHEIDNGFDFYAPQVLNAEVHDKERHILIGWIGLPEKEADYPTTNEGWIHSLTMPRELHLKNGILYQKPIDELQNLRQPSQQYDNINSAKTLPLPRQAEIHLDIDVSNSDTDKWQADLQFNQEIIHLSYDKSSAEFCIDRTALSLGGKEKRYFTVKTNKEKLNLTIFIDTSIIEIYAQNGQACATVCYYPTKKVITPKLIFNENNNHTTQCHIYPLGKFNFI